MKKRLSTLLLALILAVGLTPGALATAPEEEHDPETYLRTHYSDDFYVELKIDGDVLYVSGQLDVPELKEIAVYGILYHHVEFDGKGNMIDFEERDEDGSAVKIPAEAGVPFSVSLPILLNPDEPLERILVMYETPRPGASPYPYVGHTITEDLLIEHGAQGFRFRGILARDSNLRMEQEWINPADYLSGNISDAVRAKSDEIVGTETDEYKKLRLLHDWVAENIYYDLDYYEHHGSTDFDPEDVLETRRTVCGGYANLLRALIQAQGIPAMYDVCVTGSFPGHTDMETHAYIEAFVNGRWVRMDVTWDSGNEYEYGEFTPGESKRLYFDITPEFLAMDHVLLSRGGKVRLAVKDALVPTNYKNPDFNFFFDYSNNSFCTLQVTGMEELDAYIEEIGYRGDILIINGNAYDEDGNLLMAVDHETKFPRLDYADFSIVNENTVGKQNRPSDWALEECFLALDNGLIPYALQKNYQSPITRGDFCHAVINMLMVREGAGSIDELLARHGLAMQSGIFTDTENRDILAANLLGIVNGVGNGLFQPERSISRQEAAAMLMRTARVMGVTSGSAREFSDTDSLQNWAKEGIDFVSGLVSRDGRAVMGGTGADAFSPLNDYTTEQSILTIYRLFRCA
jgi:hypothetical protein